MRLFFVVASFFMMALAPAVQAEAHELPVSTLRQLAEWNRLDVGQFSQCVKDKKYAGKILADENEATALGAQGTPFSIVIGPQGEKISVDGAVPFEQWQILFDILLEKTPKPEIETPGALPTATNVSGSFTPVDPLHEEVFGNHSSKIMVIIYSDFDCPYCKTQYETMNKLGSKYLDIGWVYRHFPLRTIHPTAELKANAAECAHEQSPFVTLVHDLFLYQGKIDISEFSGSVDSRPELPMPKLPLPDDYYAKNIYNDQGVEIDQALARIYGSEDNFQEEIIIPSLRKTLPELKKYNLYLGDISESALGNPVVVRSISADGKNKAREGFYKFDPKTKKIKAMKINKLYQGGKGDIIASPIADRFLWVPTAKNHSARQLYVFDLLTDTRKLLVSLPASQTFDAGDPKSKDNFIEVEWLDDNKVGYTIFSQAKKSKVALDDVDWHKKLFIKDGLKKLKK